MGPVNMTKPRLPRPLYHGERNSARQGSARALRVRALTRRPSNLIRVIPAKGVDVSLTSGVPANRSGIP